MRRYPWAPIETLIVGDYGDPTVVEIGGRLGIDPRQVYRWRVSGVTSEQADRISVAMGLLPYEVWPEWLEDEIAEFERGCAAPDCPERFIPPLLALGQKLRRYCSRTCQVRTNRRRQRQGAAA